MWIRSIAFNGDPSTATSKYLTPTESANRAVTPIPNATTTTTNPPATTPTPNNNANANTNSNANAATPPPNDDESTSRIQSLFPSFENLPKVQWNIHPAVKLQLRKSFYPLAITELTLGADLDLTTRKTTLNWSWRDRLFGSHLNFTRDELSLSRSFDLDTQTRLDLRAAVDLHTRRTLFSVRVQPFGRVVAATTGQPGLAVRQTVPLDRKLDVEVAARLQLPDARFAAGNSAAVSLGDGNFVVDVDELNFQFKLQ